MEISFRLSKSEMKLPVHPHVFRHINLCSSPLLAERA